MPKKTKSDTQTLPDPLRFKLASFAELLPPRDPVVGEAPGTFEGFRWNDPVIGAGNAL